MNIIKVLTTMPQYWISPRIFFKLQQMMSEKMAFHAQLQILMRFWSIVGVIHRSRNLDECQGQNCQQVFEQPPLLLKNSSEWVMWDEFFV